MLSISDRLDQINLKVGNIVRWCALIMVIVQFCLVILRYVFGVSYIFLNESVLYLHASLFMLGAGYTLLVDKHVRVDIFYSRLSERKQRLVNLFGHLLFLIPSMIILGVYSWPSVKNSFLILEGPISVGGIPASFFLKALIPLFCILLIIQALSCLLRDLVKLVDNRTGE